MAEENKNGLVVIKLNNQKLPIFSEVKGKDWVAFGKDNLYPDFIISLFERSATNNAIITGKVNYSLGEGWKGLKKGLTRIAEAKLNYFIESINEDESLNELSEKIDLDFELFDGFYLEVIPKKNKKDFSLYHLPFNKMRTNKDESKFYYSNDWKSEKGDNPEKTGFKEYPAFDGTFKNTSVFYFRILSPRIGKDFNVYPLPNYIGGTQAIETEIECQNYNLSEIKTGFSAGTMINFYNGIPSEEEKGVIENKIRDKFTGTDRAGSFILNFADGKDRGSEVISMSGSDLHDRYTNLKKDSSKTIFTSHKVSSPELFGVQEDSVFGGRTQIAEKYELFQNTYISKRQRILEKVFNNFASLKGVSGRLIIKHTQAITTDVFSEATIVSSLPAKAIQDMIAERMGIDLSKYENTPIVTTQKMHAQYFEDNLLDAFSVIGKSKSDFEIIKSREFNFENNEQAELSEINFSDDKDVIIKPSIKINKTEILYSYEWRAGFDNSDLKTSRNFCKNLIKKDLFYTRKEINRLSNEFDTDVWTYKGGWYTKPNTDIHVPQCRHIWKQNVVRLK